MNNGQVSTPLKWLLFVMGISLIVVEVTLRHRSKEGTDQTGRCVWEKLSKEQASYGRGAAEQLASGDSHF